MEISHERFQLALSHLKPSDWERFERLSSAFLVSEWPDIRTMAAPDGDGGRDSELFRPEGVSSIVIQYSIQDNWAAKIRKTIKRLKETFPQIQGLVFLSNRAIGAKGDDLKREASSSGLFLDIRDQNWFLERANTDLNRIGAANALARYVVDPLLESKTELKNSTAGLSREEAKTALLFLELQWHNEDAGKGLTKSSFEALVKAALSGTGPAKRISRQSIRARIAEYLPRHPTAQLEPFIDAALRRLSKSTIKHWQKEDEFHLSHEEIERQRDVTAQVQIMNDGFVNDIKDAFATIGTLKPNKENEAINAVREIIGRYFARKGEDFAVALARDTVPPMSDGDLKSIIMSVSPNERFTTDRNNVDFLWFVATSLLVNPGDLTRKYLKLLSDSYTLFAFLEEAPDVQKVTKKLFTQGEIWLDTSVLLPVFAEEAFPESLRPFIALFAQAKAARAKLYVTPGILEELERHLNLCVQYTRTHSWKGRVPYVYSQYALSGRNRNAFASWVEQFCGQHRPQEDIAEYLFEGFGIEVREPIYTENLSTELIAAVREYWRRIQDARRNSRGDDPISANRLAEHDSENCLSVLSQRKADVGKSPLGYTSWWLTLDSAAWKMESALEAGIWKEIKHTPVISIDFLLKYLTFGPYRDQIAHSERAFASVLSGTILETLPTDLLDLARRVRDDSEGLPERIIQRRIRDAVDREKAKVGPVQMGGLSSATETISDTF